jgi:hypothetical protein
LQPPTPEQRAQALANLAASEAAQSAPAAPQTGAVVVPSADTPKTIEVPVTASKRKATLLGVAPEASQPAATPSVESKAGAATQMGFAAPAPVLPSSAQRPEAVSEAPHEAAARAATAADAPTPIEVPISGGAESWRGRAASDDGKPTGVAKAYHPKSEAAPAVVVDEAALRQGQAAAQAEQAAQVAARRRNINAVTIPGTVRVVPRGAGTTPDIEPIDMTALKPSKKPLVIGVLFVLLAGAGALAFAMRGSSRPQPPPAAVQAEPTPKVEAPIPAPPSAAPEAGDKAEAEASSAPSASAAPSEEPAASSAPTKSPAQSTARRPAAAPKSAAPKKTATSAPAKQRATTTQPTAPAPAKAKGVIVRDSPF